MFESFLKALGLAYEVFVYTLLTEKEVSGETILQDMSDLKSLERLIGLLPGSRWITMEELHNLIEEVLVPIEKLCERLNISIDGSAYQALSDMVNTDKNGYIYLNLHNTLGYEYICIQFIQGERKGICLVTTTKHYSDYTSEPN